MAKLGTSPSPPGFLSLSLSLPSSLPQFSISKDYSNRFTTIRSGGKGTVSFCSVSTKADNISTDNLKTQLELLHSESDKTRARANAARGRFMRLTESVENLRLRAGIELRAGKEENARQLITEKQKIMQALERSKKRAEVLDELSNKLGEAISVKESQLIALLSSSNPSVDDSGHEETTSVRIVSPRAKKDLGETEETVDAIYSDIPNAESVEGSFAGVTNVEKVDHSMSSAGSNSYLTFLSKIDNNLDEVEAQLYDFIHVAAMILPKDTDVTTNQKVATVNQIWHDVQSIRARINLARKNEYMNTNGDEGT